MQFVARLLIFFFLIFNPNVNEKSMESRIAAKSQPRRIPTKMGKRAGAKEAFDGNESNTQFALAVQPQTEEMCLHVNRVLN